MKQLGLYKGYEVSAQANALHNGLFAATLMIEKSASSVSRTISFGELDYFFEESQACSYAMRWARLWIDEQARRNAAW